MSQLIIIKLIREMRRHLFHLLLTTQLVRDFLTNLEVLVSVLKEKYLKIYKS